MVLHILDTHRQKLRTSCGKLSYKLTEASFVRVGRGIGVLPNRIHSGRYPHPTRTAVDAKLLERTGIDEFSLRKLRKEFSTHFAKLTYAQKLALAEGGTCPRYSLMVDVLRSVWSQSTWENWLRYLEHTEADIAEMCSGEYPISPYIVRVFSALFGIKVEFLLLGTAPMVDREGANIDVWPLAGSR